MNEEEKPPPSPSPKSPSPSPQSVGSSTPQSQTPIPQIPRISDAVVYNVLKNLLILDGERLSYRTLDVEQIGSVYETVMGFNLEVAAGKSIAIKPVKSHGAPATINLEALLETPSKDRAKWLKEHADQKLGAADAKLLKESGSIDELLKALDKKIARKITERVVPAGAIVLQPSDERRRSGSHYTPRSLTEPIVKTTLEPILKQLCEPVGGEESGLGAGKENQSQSPIPNLSPPNPKSQAPIPLLEKTNAATRRANWPHAFASQKKRSSMPNRLAKSVPHIPRKFSI